MVEYYRTALASNQMDHKQQNNKYMKENVSLLQEINDLRKELHAIEMNIRLIANSNVPNPQDEFFEASETQKKLKL
jgi:cell division protein FtsB